jgi:hypothetical protein
MTTNQVFFKPLIISALQVFLLSCCTAQSSKSDEISVDSVPVSSLVKDIPLPKGFKRMTPDSLSVAYYLQNLSLKEDKLVYLYNGKLKFNQTAQYAILDIDVGTKDLQQCADAAIRLRAEHLFKTQQFSKISFHFTSGHEASWVSYSNGYRLKISGSEVTWVKTTTYDTSYVNFRKYLDLVFNYCGTKSMEKEVEVISVADIQPGDVFHQTGNPYGHAITVMDIAYDSTGKTIFLLSQSYMPAQSIHILNNPNSSVLSPWYSLKQGNSLTTPEWVFPTNSLKRWKD